MKILSRPLSRLSVSLLIPAMLFSCTPAGTPGSGDVLVRVYDKYLYASDLEGLVPPGTSVRDSLTMVRTFIQNWVDKELIVKKAEENLPDELKDFSSQLDEYRNNLIIFEYEKMLVRQELDTIISSENLFEYYNRHKQRFILDRDVMAVKYVILHVDSPHVRKFRSYIQSELPEEGDSLALYCSKYAEAFSLTADRWKDLHELSDILPIESYSYREFQSNRRFVERQDSAYVYMVYFTDFKPADSISPVHFVEGEIRKVILNKRKNELIRNMRQTVLQDAVEHNQVEIY